MSGWNTRYVLYAQAHGRSPEDMLAHDELAWPGGRMAGYVLWIGAQWNRWHCERGLRRFGHVLSDADHADFDDWLVNSAAAAAPTNAEAR